VRKLWVVSAVAGLAITACGGGGDDDTRTVDTSTTSGETTTTAPEVLERDIGKTVWWEGFEISVDTLTAEPQAGTGLNVTIDATWKNLGDEPASPPTPALEREGEVLSLSTDAGQAAGQALVNGTLTGYVPSESPTETIDPAAWTDSLTLVWGEAGDNQSIVPLDESTEATTFEPQEVASFSGTITTPTVVIDVSEGTYGWSYKSGQKGKFVLKARIEISCGTPCPDEGTAMALADLTLTTPGTSSPLSPDDDNSDFCCEAVYPGTVSDDPSNTVAFVLDDEPSGSYTLTYTPDRADPVPGSLEFEI
jgi:hypothetical protein